MNNVFHLSRHALSRMESRRISNTKVAQTLFGGQIFKASRGLYKAKLQEEFGKNMSEYVVVFSKQKSKVITVEHNIKRKKVYDGEYISDYKLRKIYKQRKRTIGEIEFDSYCREEFRENNVRFSA